MHWKSSILRSNDRMGNLSHVRNSLKTQHTHHRTVGCGLGRRHGRPNSRGVRSSEKNIVGTAALRIASRAKRSATGISRKKTLVEGFSGADSDGRYS